MTTIAVDKNSISCDLQFSYRELKFKGKTKIITLKPKVASALFGVEQAYIGFAGNADIWGHVVSWFAVPDDSPPRCKGIEFLLLTSERKIYHGSNMTNWLELDEPYFSIGTGGHFAMGAMANGKTTKEAIQTAMLHDPMTGMGIKTYNLK